MRSRRRAQTIGSAKGGSWVRLGTRRGEPILWTVLRKRDAKTTVLLARQVLAFLAFDTIGKQGDDGDNRWRDSTLRHWLNSEAASGKVDFGPHPPPSADHIETDPAFDLETRSFSRRPDVEHAYDREAGFLHEWSSQERAVLVEAPITTEVVSSYEVSRRRSTDRTRDRVFLCTFEEFSKVPPALKKAGPGPGTLRTDRNENPSHWSRSPVSGFGVAVLALYPFGTKARCNSGAGCTWGVRPCAAVRSSVVFAGSGTKSNPFRVGPA